MYTKQTFLLLTMSVILFGCKPTQSWLYYADSPTAIYEDPGLTKEIITVPAGRYVFVEKTNPWGLVSYGETKGYTDPDAFKTRKKITKRDLRHLHFSSDSMYVFSDHQSVSRKSRSPGSGFTSNEHRSSSKKKSSGGHKPVSVKGHTRKNGAYVRPHTRSAPRRR